MARTGAVHDRVRQLPGRRIAVASRWRAASSRTTASCMAPGGDDPDDELRVSVTVVQVGHGQ